MDSAERMTEARSEATSNDSASRCSLNKLVMAPTGCSKFSLRVMNSASRCSLNDL